ncbi:hypothetical protein BgiMline_026862 [Biomphalaria glabrata]|nr:hypothetical protein BgiMline_021301 [Biomphalaria glabrata]
MSGSARQLETQTNVTFAQWAPMFLHTGNLPPWPTLRLGYVMEAANVIGQDTSLEVARDRRLGLWLVTCDQSERCTFLLNQTKAPRCDWSTK